MKKEIGVIFIAVSFLPSLLSADVTNPQSTTSQANQNDSRYMHPAYQQDGNVHQQPNIQGPMSFSDMQKQREQHQQRMMEQRKWMAQQREQMQQRRPVPPANMQKMREQHQQRMAEQREFRQPQRPSPLNMQQMREQHQQRMAKQREQMQQHRRSPMSRQQMREQQQQHMANMRERRQQMRTQHQRPSATDCGPQNQARNNFMRPDRPMRPNAQQQYPRPNASSFYSNRINAPQRPVYQRSANSNHRAYQAHPQWNRYQAQVNPQEIRRFYQRNHYRQSHPMMPSSGYRAAPNREQYAQRARSYYPNQAQRYQNWNRFRNNSGQNRMPPIAYQREIRRSQSQPQTLHTRPVSGPYQIMQINKAVYAR